MKILVIGGAGIVGSGIVNLLKQDHEVISLGRTSGDYQVDLEDRTSVKQMFNDIKHIDGIISTTGNGKMAPFTELVDEDIDLAINSKLKANINLLQEGIKHLNKDGFITVTSGIASEFPIAGGSSLSMVCAGIESLVKAISIEDTNGIRINAVSPSFVKETMELFGMDSTHGISSADTAQVFKQVIESDIHGKVLKVSDFY